MASKNLDQPSSDSSDNNQQAVDLIRAKISLLYADEPDAKQEIAEADTVKPSQLSKHQKFIIKLQQSGKSLPEIQTDWHNYYNSLPDTEKHQVWREFYDLHSDAKYEPQANHKNLILTQDYNKAPNKDIVNPTVSQRALRSAPSKFILPKRLPRARQFSTSPPSEIRKKVKSNVISRSQFEKRNTRLKNNLKSLAFGLSMGLVVILIFMFGFFNERFITPFIHPGTASATPIILDPTAVSPTKRPEIIIPKISVEIPLIYNVQGINESNIQNALRNGVVHYPTTVLPGHDGNSAYFGHSSNNIFNPGKYKFAFVLLHKLQKGDIFYITYNKKVYVYKVYDKRIVPPSAVQVLNDVPGKKATATLITCDPPGTSLNRLVVWGEQISPNPNTNATPDAGQNNTSSTPSKIVGNGPSLWSRIWPF